MAYIKQDWKDYPDTTTPINSERLNHMEDGISAALTEDNITTDMTSTEENKIPNTPTVKEYIDNTNAYSTDEKVVGTWIDGKTLYRKVITLSDLRTDTYIQIEVASNALIKKYEGYIQRANGAALDDLPLSVRNSKKIEYEIDSIYSSGLTGAYAIVSYTKTTDEVTSSLDSSTEEEQTD